MRAFGPMPKAEKKLGMKSEDQQQDREVKDYEAMHGAKRAAHRCLPATSSLHNTSNQSIEKTTSLKASNMKRVS